MSTEYEAALRIVREVLAPLIRADGGSLYVLSGPENSVRLHLSGRYAGCPGNTLTRRRVIEPALRRVAPEIEIVITSGAIVPEGAERIE